MSKNKFLSVEAVARICHETIRAYCIGIGDYTRPLWEDAPDWQRLSVINGVLFHLQNPDATDSAAHENWMAEKLADGWTFGLVKNLEKKEHPCLVPFTDLPLEQQVKDRLFRQTVDSLRDFVIDQADAYRKGRR